MQGEAGRWVSPETYEFMQRFKFYSRHAWGISRPFRRPLQSLARWRCERNYFRFPFEKAIIERLSPERRLS